MLACLFFQVAAKLFKMSATGQSLWEGSSRGSLKQTTNWSHWQVRHHHHRCSQTPPPPLLLGSLTHCWSSSPSAAETLIHSFITSRVDSCSESYCMSRIHQPGCSSTPNSPHITAILQAPLAPNTALNSPQDPIHHLRKPPIILHLRNFPASPASR